MMNYDKFLGGIKRLSDLTATNIKKAQVDAFYEVLNGVYWQDFQSGITSLAESGDKVNLFSLKRYINIHMAERIEKEAEIKRISDKAEIMEFWKAQFNEGKCLNHKCGECDKKFCMIVSNACIKAIKAMMSGDKTALEAHKELAKEFPGIGFEQECGIEPF